jgi:cystathionine gamma-synthase
MVSVTLRGAVESLIDHPHRMTHASVVDPALAVDRALPRVSVGRENVNDLVSDLHFAIGALNDAHRAAP